MSIKQVRMLQGFAGQLKKHLFATYFYIQRKMLLLISHC